MRGPGAWLGRLAALSGSRPVPAILGLLVLTGLGSYGLSLLSFESQATEILPEDNPHTHAAENISREFPFFFEQISVYLPIEPDKWPDANRHLDCRSTEEQPDSAWDEAYIRGVDEFVDYMRQEVGAVEYTVNMAALVKVFNWTNSGAAPGMQPDPDAYAMPGTDCQGSAQFFTAMQGLSQFPEAQQEVSQDNTTFEVTFVFDPDKAGISHNALGERIIDALENYPAWAESDQTRFQAFDTDELGAEGLPITDGHAENVTREDLATLAPIVFVLVVVLLAYAFRNLQAVVASLSTLVVAFVWSTGLLGLLGIPIANVNVAYAPLVLGVGIDYAIHMTNAILYRLSRLTGDSKAELQDAFQAAGEQVGVPTSIATGTTVIGLAILLASPSPIMGQVGLAGSVAVGTVYVATFTWLPAALSLLKTPEGGTYTPARLVPAVAKRVTSARVLTALLVVAVLAGATVQAQNVGVSSFGDPAEQFPKGDPVREWNENVDEHFFGGREMGNAFFVLQGDVQTPQAHRFVRALGNATEEEPLEGERVAHLSRIIQAYKTVRNGTAGAAGRTVLTEVLTPTYDYPGNEQGIREILDELFASPFAPFASFFTQPPDYGITNVVAEVEQGPTFADAERVWHGMNQTVQNATAAYGGAPPDDVEVTFYGNAAFSYLFIEAQMPWMETLTLVVTAAVTVLTFAVTRSIRATTVVFLESIVGAAAWLAILAMLDIPLSPLLFLPYVILVAVGTDDTLHLLLGLREEGQEAYLTVGKAITLTTVTSVAAFAMFTQMRHVGVAESMIATVVAVLLAWLLSVVLVPLIMKVVGPLPEGQTLETGQVEASGGSA